eukprot:483595-Amphidinium_carterae.1
MPVMDPRRALAGYSCGRALFVSGLLKRATSVSMEPVRIVFGVLFGVLVLDLRAIAFPQHGAFPECFVNCGYQGTLLSNE